MSSCNSPSSSSSAGVLHSNANARKEALLTKLGGTHMLHAAVDHFYDKLVADPELQRFFAHTDIQMLKWHQYNFMSIAFAHVPADFDVAELILKRHARFFAIGMNEVHFDLVINHFRLTLQELGTSDVLTEEAVDILLPIRKVFQQGAAEALARQQAEVWNMHLRTAAVAAVVSYLVVYWIRNRRRL